MSGRGVVSVARDYQAVADMARNLEQAGNNLLQSIQWSVTSRLFPEDEDAQAKFVGTVEGAWRAFVDTVIRAAGASGTPELIREMDAKARQAAQRAYQEAYNAAVGQAREGA